MRILDWSSLIRFIEAESNEWNQGEEDFDCRRRSKEPLFARFILEKEGYKVIEARDGLEAIDKISKETPDLILMDM